MNDAEYDARVEALEELWVTVQVLLLRGAIEAAELACELAGFGVDQ